jgi:peptide/nickel transport system substrate-binding protein
MNKLTRVILVGVLSVLMLALVIPVTAQDAEPGSGDPIVLPNFGADPTTFNPFLSNDGTSNTIITRIYPAFLATDPDIGYFVPGARGGIVADWEVSEDGLTYTFTLRDDYVWSDGTPVTAADLAYAWEVIQDDAVENGGNMIDIRDKVASIETPDESTVVVTFNDPNCNSLDIIAGIPVVPSHVWREKFPSNSDMNGADYNLAPEVTGDRYNFLNYRPGEQTTLVANPDYPDGYAGEVIPEGFIFKQVADQIVQTEQFLAGQLTWMGAPSARQQELLDRAKAGDGCAAVQPGQCHQYQ